VAEMSKFFVMLFVLSTVLVSLSQTSQSGRYQPGVIMAVKRHTATTNESDVAVYDVSVKVGSTIYTVLYSPPAGANRVEYSAGSELLVLVGADTLTFNSKLSGETAVPILHRESTASPPAIDWSKAPSQYFSMKQSHLSEALDLSEDQNIKIKPILEQESGEVGQFLGNPVLSRKAQLEGWEKIVESSDTKIKPFLSRDQLAKLSDLRKQQKSELRQMMTQEKDQN